MKTSKKDRSPILMKKRLDFTAWRTVNDARRAAFRATLRSHPLKPA